MEPVVVEQGDSPIILSFPHTGSFVPDDIVASLNDEGRILRDTDWHIQDLYAGLLPGTSTVRALFHRYVIDANRDPSGASLYPGQTTTELVPTATFDNVPIWRPGFAPDSPEITRRRSLFHTPYHAALQTEIERVRKRHGIAVIYDCHSIRSEVPWLFSGTLPDFNIGTDMGNTCASEFEKAVYTICAGSGRTAVLNGRFRGGWTVRHYGNPQANIHAIQMELAQSSHLEQEQPPFQLSVERTKALRPHLTDILHTIAQLAIARAV